MAVAETNTDEGIGIIQTYHIGDIFLGKHSKSSGDINYLEDMNFTGFVGNSFTINYQFNNKIQTVFHPLRMNYITTPLQFGVEEQHFTSRFEVIDFDLENGTIDLRRVE